MKFMKVMLVIAVALCLAGTVYAETQSVKVSGDLTMRGIYRDQYNYLGSADYNGPGANRTGDNRSNQEWIMSVAEIQIDADLTDNVQTVIRLVNQRDWNVYDKSINSTAALVPNGLGGYTTDNSQFEVDVDLAYVTLKDFIYSPLTLTIGRQDLWFGKGFIVGSNLQNPGIHNLTGAPNQINGTTGNLSAPEYTAMTAFDSIKAVLDYDPWTITAVYANINTGAIQDSHGTNLWGVNVGYKFDSYKAEMEGYWFWKQDSMVDVWSNIKNQTNEVHTFGLRGSFDPIDVVTLAGEMAYQGGTYVGSRLQANDRSRGAWALDASAEFRYFTDKFSWKPKLGAEFIWYSGENSMGNDAAAQGAYRGWDPMYRGKFDSAIREFVGRFYTSGQYGANSDQLISCPDASFTNQFQMIFLGSIQPMESLNVKANYNLFWNQERYNASNAKSQGWVGQELDIQATWDYTEDVSFGLLAGLYMPGEVYTNGMDHTATDLVGTVKVSF